MANLQKPTEQNNNSFSTSLNKPQTIGLLVLASLSVACTVLFLAGSSTSYFEIFRFKVCFFSRTGDTDLSRCDTGVGLGATSLALSLIALALFVLSLIQPIRYVHLLNGILNGVIAILMIAGAALSTESIYKGCDGLPFARCRSGLKLIGRDMDLWVASTAFGYIGFLVATFAAVWHVKTYSHSPNKEVAPERV